MKKGAGRGGPRVRAESMQKLRRKDRHLSTEKEITEGIRAVMAPEEGGGGGGGESSRHGKNS